MSKKTKLLIALLSATALTAGAFGIAGCAEEAYSKKYYEMYQSYVAEAGDSALSYDDWLDGVLEEAKGQQGEKGEDGEDGADGATWISGEGAPAAADGKNGDFYLDTESFTVYNKSADTWTSIGSIKGQDGAAGATGDGIQSIAYENGKLIITLKSGATKEVELPSAITHEHTYGDTVTVIIPSTLDNEGIGYKKCNGCEHIELVPIPIPEYNITLTYAGAPLANTVVTISGAGISDEGYVEAATDEDGKVTLKVLALGEYSIQIDGYTILGSSKTSATTTDMAIEVAKSMTTTVNDWGETSYSVEESGTYVVTVTSGEQDWGWGPEPFIKCHAFSIVAGEENAMVKITLNSTEGIITDEYGYAKDDVADDGSYTAIIRAGESDSIGCSVDSSYFDSGRYSYGDTIVYSINVEYLEAPADGTIEELALDGAALTDGGITMTAEPDQWIYYTWTNPDTSYSRLNITLGEGTTLEFTTKSNWTNVPVTLTESGVIQFTDTAFTTKFSFKVKSSTGNISLSAEFYAEVGEMSNPAELALDTQTSGTVSSGAPKYYYKWTAAEAGNYTLVVSGASTAEVYSDASYSDEYMLLNIQSDRGVFAAEAGKTYYFAAGTTNVYTATEYQILLRKTTAEDAGSSAAYPVALTAESSLSFDNFEGTRYYTYENSSEEAVTFKLVTAGNEDTSVSVGYYSDSTYSWSSNIGSGSVAVTVEAGQTIYVLLQVYAAPNNFTGTATVEIGVPEPPVEPDIPEGVEPTEVQTPNRGAITGAGYWQISVTAEDLWTDYYEVTLYFIGEAGTYNITCQEGATLTDRVGDPLTQIVSTGSQVTFYLDADKIGDYIITITEVTEQA